MQNTPIVLLSGRDLQQLLRPQTAIAALREANALSPTIVAIKGDLNHALQAGAVSKEKVHADPADLVVGKRGRASPDELVNFDSSGSAVQDVAAAWAAYREAVRAGVPPRVAYVGNRGDVGASICLGMLSEKTK
jgi:ornithine cyclodeaminase/alanine dehydrogenase-like protein (mu-crystallin family)